MIFVLFDICARQDISFLPERNLPNSRQKRIAFETFQPLKTLLNIYGMKDVERKDSFGKTPIHYAQTEGHFSTARILELRLSESNCAAKRFKSQ